MNVRGAQVQDLGPSYIHIIAPSCITPCLGLLPQMLEYIIHTCMSNRIIYVLCVFVCVCVCVCVRARARVCVCVCVYVCDWF